jgi:nucleoside 2-deoxyribosyltransferase
VAARNESLLRSATVVFAVLDGPDADAGTAADVGFACALAKPIVGWRSDIRGTAPGMEGPLSPNLMHMVKLHGGSLHTDLGTAISAVAHILAAPKR